MKSICIKSNSLFLTIMYLCATSLHGSPHAYNDAATTVQNTPVVINVLANDIFDDVPLDPTEVMLNSAPSNGLVSLDNNTGVITYTPGPFFIGIDSFQYRVRDINSVFSNVATVFVTVNQLNEPCPTNCTTDCCLGRCFDKIDECMCDADSFARFTPASGAWSQSGNYITTQAAANSLNFLQYNTLINQTYEIIEVTMNFPSTQANSSPFISAGIVTNWNGTDVGFANQKVAYLSFDNTSGNPQNPKLAIGGLNTETVYNLNDFGIQINYDTEYTLRILKNQQQAYAFLDDTYIGTSVNGIVTGNYVGVWSFQAAIRFRDLKSCSYTDPVVVPVNEPFAPIVVQMFPV